MPRKPSIYLFEDNSPGDQTPRQRLWPQRSFGNAAERARRNINAKLSNPLAGFSHAELRRQGRTFAISNEIGDDASDIRAFELGAVLAQAPEKYEKVRGLTAQEKEVLRQEFANRWSQPWSMYAVIALCSLSAAVQEWTKRLETWLSGLVNAAPYLCCAFLGCWLTVPFNHYFGRRGTIFLTCCFSALACLWQSFTSTWWGLFVARFALGLGIGPKSATVPVYAAETAPPAIRGALVMQWQMWTAFGIMLGYAADLAFYHVPDPKGVVGLNWRLMLGSALLPALVVCAFVFFCPESPRWYMAKKQYYRAYRSICAVRHNKIQAARDMYYMYTLLEAENSMKLGQNKLWELITVPRNRRAMLASEIVMFLQQFCGVNVIAYYSSEIFLEANFSAASALGASLGWGVINWVFAIPAVYTIDTFGRRNLLLVTFPLMAVAMFFTGFSFWIPDDTDAHHAAHIGCVALGLYLFGIVYSPGEGPVPFTYSAEVYPLYVRSYGMALATATLWFFNFVLGVTWPSLSAAFTIQGGFAWYAGWNIVGFWLILLFMPETKGKTLEELDQVFSVPTRFHAQYGLRQIRYVVKRYVLRDKNVQPEILYEKEEMIPVQDLGYNA
ncbi:hypothetical protein N7468_006950 [Penicillium chermesinum]|uniref:Major facilitator superfamily (MFS) profile domain-containing protein n=1 Tax=Penicillium chermesinum TaxID=63820 RepID=A0A9W9TLQ0_9EURO|nr:uncharacterized protein N7468_006950 [Penicillium chermesinum]KAJ5225725.1 hypothetical protein N7468_006950 [Penicillium chermesinum]